MERIYEKGLYDLDLEGILRYLGHDNNTFIGQVKREDNKFFLVNLYSDDEEQKGKLLVDLLYGDNIRVSIEKSIELNENNFYKIRISLFPKETRLAQGTPFLFSAQIIENVHRNPYEIDVDQAFKKNDNPSSNRNLVRTLAEVGKGMYSSKDRMFFELIQNADDASSKEGVLLDVFTEGDYLIISHDGFNFDRNDFKAINSSANGTKKANENKTGYKGIGFKSVFTDSEEVFIKTGGYQFKFDKHDSRFSDFESFYFFVREINSEESRINFLNKFADEKKEFNGVKDIPWQIVPIWVDKFPDELFSYFTKNVSIALKLGKNNIEGDNGYKKAIEEIIENPKFVLFLRNTKQILFNGGIIRKKENDNKIILENSKGNSIDTFERRNFEIKFDEKTFGKRKIDIRIELKKDNENDKPIAVFVDLKGEEIENIPKKISMNNATEISFAVATFGADEGINPDKKCSNISLFAFLPTLVKDFKFPFYINANFILDPPRQRILGDNPWNCFLMQEIAIQMVNWCAELSARGEKNALNILITEEFSERDADTRQLAENFNTYYRRALEEIPFILDQSGKVVKQENIIIDDTGLSEIIGEDLFYRITGKKLPSSKIDSSILKNRFFRDIKHIGLNFVLERIETYCYKEKIKEWYINAFDIEKELFHKWLIDNKVKKMAYFLPTFKVAGHYFPFNYMYQNPDINLITTKKILPIKDILLKLGYRCSDNLLEDHPLKEFFFLQDEQKIFEGIMRRKVSSLLAEEKLRLIEVLKSFNKIGKETIRRMVIFHNVNGILKPLNQMLSYREEYPDWLAPYIISKEEDSSELKEYLIEDKDEFSKIVWDLLGKIKEPIVELYERYRWTDSRYTLLLIERYKNTNKIRELLPIIEEADKRTQEYYLLSIQKIILSTEGYYTEDSFEYKIMQLALKICNNLSDFASKIYIDKKCIRDFSVKDEVVCSYKENNIEKKVTMSLSKLLSEYQDQSDTINKVKRLFKDKEILDKFLDGKEKPLGEIYNEIVKIPIENYSAYQYLFLIYFRKMRGYYNEYVPNIDLTQRTEDFVFEIMDFLYQNKINITSIVPFTYHLWKFFQGKYFDNDYILDTERLSLNIEKWVDTSEKRVYLKSNGVRENNDRNIQFRKAFVENTPFEIDEFNRFTESELLSNIDYFFKREDLQKPFIGEYQTYIVNKISSFKYIRIEKKWDLLEAQEWGTQEYTKWKERHYMRIFLFNGVFPIDVLYKENLFIRYFEKEKYLYNYSTKSLYINDKENIDDILFILAKEGKIRITLDDYQTLCREGKVMISQEDAQKLKHYNEIKEEKEALEEKNKSLEAELERFRRLSSVQTPPVEADIQENIQQTSEEYTTNKVLHKGNLSKEKQIDAHKEAALKSKKTLEKVGYDCSKWILNEENDSPGFWQSYSQVSGCIKNPQGEYIDIVVKSAKTGTIHLSATDLDLLVANKHNILVVWDGTTVHSITNEELFGQNSNINLIFDTKNTPYEYYSALSGFFKYIKGTTFVVKDPKHNVYGTIIEPFDLDKKREGKQDSLTEEAL